MNVEHINPFIEASLSVLKCAANINGTMGKVYLKVRSTAATALLLLLG